MKGYFNLRIAKVELIGLLLLLLWLKDVNVDLYADSQSVLNGSKNQVHFISYQNS